MKTSPRTLSQLIAPDVVTVPNTSAPPLDEELVVGKSCPPRGKAQKGHGYTATTIPYPVYRMPATHAAALWPFICAKSLPPIGMPVGFEISAGTTFYVGPSEWVKDPRVSVTNNNVLVVGKPGGGKTATVKTYLMRRIACGAQVMIWGDTKNEYAAMVRYFGSEPVELGPGMPGRLNPLDMGFFAEKTLTAHSYKALEAHWVRILEVIITAQRDGTNPVHVGPSERVILAAALAQACQIHHGNIRPIIIPDVLQAMSHPEQHLLNEAGYSTADTFKDATRVLRHSIHAFITGPLAGMFDAHTNIAWDTTAPIQSLSLQSIRRQSEEVVAVALMCLKSFAEAYRTRTEHLRINVHDESWYTSRLGTQFIKDKDSAMRLSRADNEENWQIMHQFSDLLGAGADAQAVEIAKSAVAKADTIIMHGLEPSAADDAARLLNLEDPEHAAISGWALQQPGRAVWRVAGQCFRVQTYRTPTDAMLSDSNNHLKTAADLS